jgi:hypothetical protein
VPPPPPPPPPTPPQEKEARVGREGEAVSARLRSCADKEREAEALNARLQKEAGDLRVSSGNLDKVERALAQRDAEVAGREKTAQVCPSGATRSPSQLRSSLSFCSINQLTDHAMFPPPPHGPG